MREHERELGIINANGEDITLIQSLYADGRPAILARDAEGLPYGTLSVNPDPEVALPQDCVAIKAWSENASLAQTALASGLFEDTGERLSMGYETAPVWRIK